MPSKSFATTALFCCVCSAPISQAFAQSSESQIAETQTYQRSYFDQFSPQTARDMVDRLPGFTLDIGTDLRGFGGSAGNVLVNGARPSSKAGGIEDALQRINAASVERIEVIRGSAGSSETAGQAVVANIISSQSDRTARWELQLERAAHARINVASELALAGTIAGWDASAIVSGSIERRPLDGTRITRDASDMVTFGELENSPSYVRRIAISSEGNRSFAGGTLSLNGRFSHTPGSTDTERFGSDGEIMQGRADQRRLILFERTTTDVEFGTDWTRPLSNGWSLKLLSLSSFEDSDSRQLSFLERPTGTDVSSSIFDSQQETFETVFRTTVGRSGEYRFQPEFGAEIAYNRLNSNLALQAEDLGGSTNISLPAANVLVEELRGEAFANLIWRVSDRFTLETGLGAELSQISVSGDADNTQSFFFAKPFAALIYNPRPGLQFRLGVRRTVGQLDFTDFAASASAADDRLTAGNPSLGPDQTTRLSSSVDFRAESGAALNVEIFHEWRNDILEQIVLPSGAQGLGNAGSARVWGVTSTASLPLSFILPGGLIEAEIEFLDSTFRDPLLSGSRPISSIDSPNIFIEFRHDIPDAQISWGLSYRAPTDGPFFFADEISFNRDSRTWSAFLETTRFLGIKINFELAGIGRQNFFRRRSFFAPDRGGAFTGSETISRDRGMFAALTFSGQF